MKILFCGYQSISFMKGGPTYKIQQLKRSLEKLSVKVDLFNQWENDSVDHYDLIHIFNAHSGTYHFAKSLQLKSIKYVVNPIFYSKHSKNVLRAYLYLQKLTGKLFKGTLSVCPSTIMGLLISFIIFTKPFNTFFEFFVLYL